MPTWPFLIPKLPLAKGFDERPPDTVLRSSIESGPPKARQRYTAGVSEVTATYYLSEDELELFQEFFETECAGGAVRFDWYHPRLKKYVEARFNGLPNPRPAGPGKYFVQVKFEIMP